MATRILPVRVPEDVRARAAARARREGTTVSRVVVDCLRAYGDGQQKPARRAVPSVPPGSAVFAAPGEVPSVVVVPEVPAAAKQDCR